jgi:cation:H+ antiporter
MDLENLGWLLAGLLLLGGGAELLVRGAARLAAVAGISPLVIGLTVVAYGTSAPELAVSLQAAWSGNPEIAIANAVGSNVFNVLFILGTCALVLPLAVAQQLVRLDVPIMIGVSVLLWVLSLDGRLGAVDGGLLVTAMGLYTVWAIRQSRKENAAVQAEYVREYGRDRNGVGVAPSAVGHVALVLAGLAVLVIGARWLVASAIVLAQGLGVSSVVVGLTIVAAGTSLPEVATSLIATFRGERDIAIGNVVGSNIYNILAILGLSSLLAPTGLTVAPSVVAFDIPLMIAVAVACLPIFFTGYTIDRWEGALLLGYYAAYTLFLILRAAEHDRLADFNWAMLWFVLPLTALTLAVLAAKQLRARPTPGSVTATSDERW